MLLKLSTGMLIAFPEEMLTFSEPIQTHKNNRAERCFLGGFFLAVSDAPFHHGLLNFVNCLILLVQPQVLAGEVELFSTALIPPPCPHSCVIPSLHR